MEQEQKLRKKIMRRVFAVYLARVTTTPVAKTAVLLATLGAIVSSVSLKDILANTAGAAHAPGSLAFYLADAFLSTEFLIQLFFMVSAVLAVVLIRDVCMACVSGSLFGFLRRA